MGRGGLRRPQVGSTRADAETEKGLGRLADSGWQARAVGAERDGISYNFGRRERGRASSNTTTEREGERGGGGGRELSSLSGNRTAAHVSAERQKRGNGNKKESIRGP